MRSAAKSPRRAAASSGGGAKKSTSRKSSSGGAKSRSRRSSGGGRLPSVFSGALRKVWLLFGFGFTLLAGLWACGVCAFGFRWDTGWTVLFGLFAVSVWLAALRYGARWLWLLFGAEMLVAFGFALITPGERFAGARWQKQWSRIPVVRKLSGGGVHIGNIRNCFYRTADDFDLHYLDWELRPEDVRTVDVALSHFDGLEVVAHTMMSFGFADGRYLVVSMETRRPEGEAQSFVRGVFKNFELIMVMGTEEDVLRLRSNFRMEELYLYRTNATPEQARMLFEEVCRRAAELEKRPEFYHSVKRNCTTSLTPMLRIINPGFERDIRLLCNGHSDELLFELGYLKSLPGESFSELKKRRDVGNYSRGVSEADYSSAIRRNL